MYGHVLSLFELCYLGLFLPAGRLAGWLDRDQRDGTAGLDWTGLRFAV